MAGYAIGYFLFETSASRSSVLRQRPTVRGLPRRFNEWGVWILIIKGLTPFPYKVVTIAAGAAHMDSGSFMLASIVARAMRFYLVAALLYWFGEPIRDFIERRLTLVTTVFVVPWSAASSPSSICSERVMRRSRMLAHFPDSAETASPAYRTRRRCAVRCRRGDPGGARLPVHRRLSRPARSACSSATPTTPASRCCSWRWCWWPRTARAGRRALPAGRAGFLANAGLGVYHAGAEWKFWPGPDTCGARARPAARRPAACSRASRRSRVVRCDEAPGASSASRSPAGTC